MANMDVSPQCQQTLLKVTTELLHAEGFQQINTCAGMGSSDNCQLDFYACKTMDNTDKKLCNLRYTYGGAYPNYNDYVITVDNLCQILGIEITRL
jgi:hypothetical protein